MAGLTTWEGTVRTVPIPEVASLVGTAPFAYPIASFPSIALAAHVIGMRCGLSRQLAPVVVELAGYRGCA